MLAFLLPDLKKVNVEYSIFIIEFENLTVSYFWLLTFGVFFFSQALKQKHWVKCAQCWWYFSFPQFLSKNVRYDVHNVNVNTFSYSRKLLSGENTFFIEYLQATASSKYPPEKLFKKSLKDSSENTLEA